MTKNTSGRYLAQQFNALNEVERNCVLYYADYLSLEHTSKPVTDNCKYYFIHGLPINSAYILDMKPLFNPANGYIIKALKEYKLIKNKFGDEGVESYIGDICMLRARGCVNAIQMLEQIHLHSTKKERLFAFKEYHRWINEQKYEHLTKDEEGNQKWERCTRYVSHAERKLFRRRIPKNTGNNDKESKEDSKKPVV